MRFLSSIFAFLMVIFLSSAAVAQDANIQWKDLSAGERQSILNTWRALPNEGKTSFMTYRAQALKDLSDEKKAKYAKIAEERSAREIEMEKAYEKRQENEKKLEMAKPEPIAPIDSTPMEEAKPAGIPMPTPVGEDTKKSTEKSESKADTAKKMLDKFF